MFNRAYSQVEGLQFYSHEALTLFSHVITSLPMKWEVITITSHVITSSGVTRVCVTRRGRSARPPPPNDALHPSKRPYHLLE